MRSHPAPDIARLRDVVGAVPDPLVGRPFDEFGLIEDVSAHGGRVRVRLRTLACDPDHARAVEAAVRAALTGLDGVRGVAVDTVPLDDEARAALAGRLRAARQRPGSLRSGCRTYAIGSGKGGVGKSSLAANLAVALARSGQRVGLLDADVWGYSVPQLFGIRAAPVAAKGLMLPPAAHGVRLMSIGFFVAEDQPVVWRGPMLHKALEQLLNDVCWGPLDVLLLDLPPGTGDIPLTIMQLIPAASLLLVTTPQPAAARVAARVGRMAAEARMPLAGVIENMTGSVFGADGGRHLADELDTTLLGAVPLDERLRRAGDAGVPLAASTPRAPAARAIAAIAARLPVIRPNLAGRPLPLTVAPAARR